MYISSRCGSPPPLDILVLLYPIFLGVLLLPALPTTFKSVDRSSFSIHRMVVENGRAMYSLIFYSHLFHYQSQLLF